MPVEYCHYCDQYIDLDWNLEHFTDDGVCERQIEEERLEKSEQPMPKLLDPPQTQVQRVKALTLCCECGKYRAPWENAIVQPDYIDFEGNPYPVLCSWVCAIAVNDRGIIADLKKYGMDADQVNKFTKEGRFPVPLGDFDFNGECWIYKNHGG